MGHNASRADTASRRGRDRNRTRLYGVLRELQDDICRSRRRFTDYRQSILDGDSTDFTCRWSDLLVLTSVWTVIKPSYREFVSQGTRSQTVGVDIGQSLAEVDRLSGVLDADKVVNGFVGAALRISYVEIPSYVMQRVPDILPYQYGALWGEAIYEVLTPRLLFPGKPILPSDSVRTNRYTGKNYETVGTSVSMGYLIESYIDFGVLGALFIPFVLGMLYSLIAQHILKLGGRYDLTFCIAALIVLFLPVQQFEISNIKLFPGMLWNWIVCSIVVWVVWPRVRPWFRLSAPAQHPNRSSKGNYNQPV